jgi:hypothetical protein
VYICILDVKLNIKVMLHFIHLFIDPIIEAIQKNWTGAGVSTRGGRFARGQGARISGR